MGSVLFVFMVFVGRPISTDMAALQMSADEKSAAYVAAGMQTDVSSAIDIVVFIPLSLDC